MLLFGCVFGMEVWNNIVFRAVGFWQIPCNAAGTKLGYRAAESCTGTGMLKLLWFGLEVGLQRFHISNHLEEGCQIKCHIPLLLGGYSPIIPQCMNLDV